jgi:hypothetical protein
MLREAVKSKQQHLLTKSLENYSAAPQNGLLTNYHNNDVKCNNINSNKKKCELRGCQWSLWALGNLTTWDRAFRRNETQHSNRPFQMSVRRNVRLRKEYLYRKSLEPKQRETFERKRALKRSLETGAPIPTELRDQEALQHVDHELQMVT